MYGLADIVEVVGNLGNKFAIAVITLIHCRQSRENDVLNTKCNQWREAIVYVASD